MMDRVQLILDEPISCLKGFIPGLREPIPGLTGPIQGLREGPPKKWAKND